MTTIECKKRPEGSKPKALRREGLLPANLYGHNVPESVHLVLNMKEMEMLLKKASRKQPVELNIPDLTWSGKAMIQEVQSHPWRGDLYHISFFSIE